MPPAPFVLLALAALAPPCKSREVTDSAVATAPHESGRSDKSLEGGGCLFEGAWYRAGARVEPPALCLHCRCVLGALSCRRRACRPLPDPPPAHCHVRHRKGACCPELHCPDGVILMEQEASARLDDDDVMAPTSMSHVFPACVEGGSVYAAGSAMGGARACEHCFCLRGARRCVRPRCLPPPAGCSARAAPGACCPDRYHCDHHDTEEKHPHDCLVEGRWVKEGEAVPAANCSQCFCLRGAVQCQAMACAPPLLGCTPLLRPGDCCAHHYHCQHQHGSQMLTLSTNALSPVKNNDRAFHNTRTKQETATKNTLTKVYTAKDTPKLTATKNHLVSTVKVKRKTSDPPPETTSVAPELNTTLAPPTTTTAEDPTTRPHVTDTTVGKVTTKVTITTSTIPTSLSTTELTTEMTLTEQPEGSVRIMINGTINCTAELSSTSLPLNVTFNDTEKITQESLPRVPLIDVSNLEDHTFSANDIITDRTVNGGFDENESFVINVTSSLNANTLSHPNFTSTRAPAHTVSVSAPPAAAETNSSKKTKGDYDYDYTEPTLPPSLPNLKIIPFVAADAVVDDDNPKETLTYPILEREDKFPVYYPSGESKDSSYESRREDGYRSTQYPVFITDKPDAEYPSLTPELDPSDAGYDVHPAVDAASEYTAPADGLRAPAVQSATPPSLTTTTFKLETPAVNRFSPPMETEGGFVPKGPTGLIEEYFAVFPSTPAGPPLPHLTTSMQLDVDKEECVTSDGRRVPAGGSVSLVCSQCSCSWGSLECTPRACPTPARCVRRPPTKHDADPCCGDLLCEPDNNTIPTIPEATTAKLNVTEATPVQTSTETRAEVNHPVPANHRPAATGGTDRVHTDTGLEYISQLFGTFTNDSKSRGEVTSNNSSTNTSSTTEETATKAISTAHTRSPANNTPPTATTNQSLEYEEEDEDDEGFSFGSVLKLLLSDNYESTTPPPKKIPTTTRHPARPPTTTRRPRPTLPPRPSLPPQPSIAPFVPLPVHSHIPPKGNQNSINRIDHLVLGEATAIKQTTPRPAATTRVATSRPSTGTSARPTKPAAVTIEQAYSQESPRPPGLGPGLLKLAGCNIYGRMYRVGRIIAELSTPCQECWCSDTGVQCKPLPC